MSLRDEIINSMEYSDRYKAKQRKADAITWVIIVVLIFAFITLITQ